ncbi:MAG: helix-turn-helix domain-containing protein [Candidatus Cloacimonetes bacterium]|jgi:predicted transcriptional regulator|nr:helix-turn-helix domain-containing protein [Candidatus Cloacimonadota bacterium]MCB5260142.1 helix-turn-helix domain-containing protein [Candidatus Cloacimonadota bacterium]
MASMNNNAAEEIKAMNIFKDERNYRTDEIADILRVDRSSVYRWIRDILDPLPAFRTKENGQLRCSGRDLNEYLESHKVRPEYE